MWSFWTSWICRWMFSIKLVKFSAIISSVIFHLPFSHPLSSRTFSTASIGKSFGVPLVCEALFIFHLFFFSLPQTGYWCTHLQVPRFLFPVHICCLAPQLISFILFLYFLSSRVSISFHNLCLLIDIFYFVWCCYHTLIL